MFEKPRTKPVSDIRPARCSVLGCDEPCDVYIRKYNIARCATHYLEDLERAGLTAMQQVKQLKSQLQSEGKTCQSSSPQDLTEILKRIQSRAGQKS